MVAPGRPLPRARPLVRRLPRRPADRRCRLQRRAHDGRPDRARRDRSPRQHGLVRRARADLARAHRLRPAARVRAEVSDGVRGHAPESRVARRNPEGLSGVEVAATSKGARHMKRILFLLAVAALGLPAAALAKGPSEARITGPGLGKTIVIAGVESEGTPIMNLAEATGFFPGAFGQSPSPMSPAPPKSGLGPRYSIDYVV